MVVPAPPPAIEAVSCRPVAACPADSAVVTSGVTLRLAVQGGTRPLRVRFTTKPGAARPTVTVRAVTRPGDDVDAVVPALAGDGPVTVTDATGAVSSPSEPLVVAPAPADTTGVAPFTGDSMWVWYVRRSDGGSPARMARRAVVGGVDTVLIKASDGGASWGQFSPSLVAALHRRGLRVCAWQFVYGAAPRAEAAAGVRAVAAGADCLAIDAETAYEGRYAAARTYMAALRRRLGLTTPSR